MVEECGHGGQTGVYVVWVYGGYSWGLGPASCGKWFMRHSSLLGRHCLLDISPSSQATHSLVTTGRWIQGGLINSGILMGAFKIPSKLVQQRQWLKSTKKLPPLVSTNNRLFPVLASILAGMTETQNYRLII